MTLGALSSSTGLSRRTVEAVLDSLRADDIVAEVSEPSGPRSAGRPARSYRFVAESGALVAVQVAAHEVLAVVADLNGTVVGRATQAVRSTTPRRGRLSAIRTAVDRAVASSPLRPERVRLISLGTPGIVRASGHVATSVLPEWSEFDLAGTVAERFGCPVRVNNDINLAALGERWRGTSAAFDDSLWLLTGRRTSMGIIIDGQLYQGQSGAAGEIGLQREYWDAVRTHPLSFYGATGRSESDAAEEIARRGAQGSPDALESVEEFARLIAAGLSGAILSFDPGCVVVGGPLARLSGLLLPALARELGPRVYRVPELFASSLGTEAPAQGAIRVALDAVDDDLRRLWLGDESGGHDVTATLAR